MSLKIKSVLAFLVIYAIMLACWSFGAGKVDMNSAFGAFVMSLWPTYSWIKALKGMSHESN